MVEEQRDWAKLPNELLEHIVSYIYDEKDITSFHGVCKSWHAAEYLIPQSPWLLHKQCGETTYCYFHPFFKNVIHSKDDVEQVTDAVPRVFKNGWILMSSGWREMFFFNPSTKRVIQLPDLPDGYAFMGITFSSTPTSSDCLVLGISGYLDKHVTISTFYMENAEWGSDVYQNSIDFNASSCSPVIHNQMVYCLGEEGNLGVYNLMEDEWTVLSNPQSPCRRESQNYLLNYENEIMSVFVGLSQSWVSVFKLDESMMAWEEVNDLGEYALFLSPATTFATKGVGHMFKNKIFLPVFADKHIVFYSLETRKFHTFGSNLCKETLEGTKVAEQLEACWIVPDVGLKQRRRS